MKYSHFISGIFYAFLGGLLIWHAALPDRARSETENRLLEQRPSFRWETLADGSFTRSVEDYFADQFPMRDQWTGLKARMEQLMGKAEYHGVYLCGDTLISKVEAPEDGLEEKNLSCIARFASASEVPVYLGLIPSAAEIWKDLLPDGAESWNQTAFFAEASEKAGPALSVDLFSTLTDHSAEPVFYRTDHHWTSLGAFYGANALLEALGKDPLERTAFRPERASAAFQGTLYSTSGVHWLEPDTMEFWVSPDGLSVTSWQDGSMKPAVLYDRSYLSQKDKYSAFLGGNQPLCVIQNPAARGQGKLLLIRDSYADSLAPFLAQRFEEVHLIDLRYYRDSPLRYAAEHDIDRITVLYSIPNLITDRNLVFLTQ